MNSKNYITASEIGEYVYCKRAWWLRNQGLIETTPHMVRGSAAHNALAFKLNLSFKLKIIALLIIGIAVLLIALIITSITAS